MQAKDITNISEMAEFFPSSSRQVKQPIKVTAVASRFWHPGDTYEQALARQQQAWNKLNKQCKQA